MKSVRQGFIYSEKFDDSVVKWQWWTEIKSSASAVGQNLLQIPALPLCACFTLG